MFYPFVFTNHSFVLNPSKSLDICGIIQLRVLQGQGPDAREVQALNSTQSLTKELVLYSQKNIFLITYEWAQKAKVFHTLGWEGLTGTNTLAYWAQAQVTVEINCCECGPRLY